MNNSVNQLLKDTVSWHYEGTSLYFYNFYALHFRVSK